jgi:hypothetical protein
MKKLITLGIALAMLATMIIPMSAFAAGTVVISGTVGATPTVISVTADNGDVSTAPDIAIVGTNFVDGQTTVSLTGAAGITPGTVTFTDTAHISCTFTIAAGAASGPRNVYVTAAGKISTEVVTFTVNGWMTVNAPDTGNSLGTMAAGATKTAEITGGTVTSNWANDWQVTAIDAKGTAKGYMNTAANGSGTSLAAKFQIGQESGTYQDADTTLTYSTKPSTLPFFISQVVASDATAGSYQITITFTGSGN